MMFGTPCTHCKGPTAIGADKRGEPVRVCVLNGHREAVPEASRKPQDAAPAPWWAQ